MIIHEEIMFFHDFPLMNIMKNDDFELGQITSEGLVFDCVKPDMVKCWMYIYLRQKA